MHVSTYCQLCVCLYYAVELCGLLQSLELETERTQKWLKMTKDWAKYSKGDKVMMC